MSRCKAAISQFDLTRCTKATRAAGYQDFRVEIENTDVSRISIEATKQMPLPDGRDDIDSMISRLP